MHTLTTLTGIRSDLTLLIRSASSDVLLADLCHEAAMKIDMAIAIEKGKMKREINEYEPCPNCCGAGYFGLNTDCKSCNGTGKKRKELNNVQN